MGIGCNAGEEWRARPKLAATIRLFNYAFFRKIITRHDTGMGESYMDGDYEVSTVTCLVGRHDVLDRL